MNLPKKSFKRKKQTLILQKRIRINKKCKK